VTANLNPPSTTVSVVIATRNRARLLARTLDALGRQQWPAPQLEVLVADNASTDDTRDVVARAAAGSDISVRYLRVATPGKSNAVNEALALTRGAVLAFTDDDVVPEPGWIAALVTAMNETSSDFAAGRIAPLWEVEPPHWMSPALFGVLAIPDNGPARLRIAADEPHGVMPIGANMAVRASVVERIGGLRTDLGKLEGSLRTGEDHEFFLRLLHAGCRGVYEPAARVFHLVPADRLRRSYFRRWLYQNGRDVACLERSYRPEAAMLLGVPRYLWRRAIADALTSIGAALRGDAALRLAASVRVLWFAGYLREAWLPAGPSAEARLSLAEIR
jgi:glycosyltransferase involved in cell wall biosynthesis